MDRPNLPGVLGHEIVWTGHGTFFNPRVVYCVTCTWTCAGAYEAMVEAAEKHAKEPVPSDDTGAMSVKQN